MGWIPVGIYRFPGAALLRWPVWVEHLTVATNAKLYPSGFGGESLALGSRGEVGRRWLSCIQIVWIDFHLMISAPLICFSSEKPRIPVSHLDLVDSEVLAAAIPTDPSSRHLNPCPIFLFSDDSLLWNQLKQSACWEDSATRGHNPLVNEGLRVCRKLLEPARIALCTPPFRLAGTHPDGNAEPFACTPL